MRNKLSIKVLMAVITNLAFSADKVALRVAADVVGVRFRSRLHLWVRVIHVCSDDIFGEAEEWAEK